ncbi:hypothetical protein [Rhizobium ruizarguesonis]|uniref:hypothetical protein n=1 Tax=Rhizobium ruizarguesonis TaxID=2081791 RepID=UPI00370FE220
MNYLAERQAEVLQIDRKERADVIVREAEAGDLEALHKLNMMNDELSRNPVLVDIAVERMATLIAKDVPSLNIGARLLAYRYHDARHGDPLLTEMSWARQVYEAVLRKMADWPEHHRFMATENLQGLIRHYQRGHHPDDQIIPVAAGAEETDAAGDGKDASSA